MAQVSYEVGDRILENGVLFEVALARWNRWGGRVYRIAPVLDAVAPSLDAAPGPAPGRPMARWLTPRFDGTKSKVIDRPALAALVHTFYDAVRADARLAPVFAARLDGHWPEHLERMVSFWASVTLGEGSFSGNPMAKHRALVEVRPELFARWLALFDQTLATLFEPGPAAELHARALAIARRLSTGLFGQPYDAAV